MQAVLGNHAPQDLAERFQPGMEAFVQVDPERGEQVYDRDSKKVPNTYDDGVFRYYNFRIQHPDDVDQVLTYPLEDYFDAIGYSGWDVVRNVAIGVGYDFDSLVNHDEGTGLTQEALDEVLEALKRLQYVEIRRSTSGHGYHVWVWFPEDDLPPVKDRPEMKALARAVMHKMAFDTGHNFVADVDHIGDILWVCARRATPQNGGLTVVQAANEPLPWPRDFHDHLEVVTRKRRRRRINGVRGDAASVEDAANNHPLVRLEPAHRRFVKEYERSGYYGQWNEDHACYVCHTVGIAKALEHYKMPGVFMTDSRGTDSATPNCWMYPLAEGAWRIYRFNDVGEAPTWDRSRKGHATCVIGRVPQLKHVAARFDGKSVGKGTYMFLGLESAAKAVSVYGGELKLPGGRAEVGALLIRVAKEGGLEVEFRDEALSDKDANAEGWTSQPKKWWRKYLDVETSPPQSDFEYLADDLVRLVARDQEQIGLYACTQCGWHRQSPDIVKARLTHEGIPKAMQDDVLGWCAKHPYIRVARPFAPEYPGDREWNLDGCQLMFAPAESDGETPHWDRILDHLGRGLQDAVESDPWCAEHGILSGTDFLKHWYANIIRFPERRLPMLALYSKENSTGKSLVHEAPAVLFDERGYTLAAKAIKNSSGFDAELDGSVLCAVEEVNLAKASEFYANLKKQVTSQRIDITYKGADTIMVTNYTHWTMTTNHREYIPIEPGDQRIILWEVPPFEGDDIPKEKLFPELRKEAPFFLRQLFQLDLSHAFGRLTLPVLLTPEKVKAMNVVAEKVEPTELDGDKKKLVDAIQVLQLPWGPGTATQLCEALGDWDGNAETKRLPSRAMSLGRYLPGLQGALLERGISLMIQGKDRMYSLSA